jgi:hypothetical protein
MEEEIPKVTIINEKEIICDKHGKQELFDFGDIKCPKCFNDYWKKRYFL